MLLSLTHSPEAPQSAGHGWGHLCSSFSMSQASHGGQSLKTQAKMQLEEMLKWRWRRWRLKTSVSAPWHETMGAITHTEDSGGPEPFPFSTTTFPHDLQAEIFGKPSGTGGSCRLQCLIVGISIGIKCLISHYSPQGANQCCQGRLISNLTDRMYS